MRAQLAPGAHTHTHTRTRTHTHAHTHARAHAHTARRTHTCACAHDGPFLASFAHAPLRIAPSVSSGMIVQSTDTKLRRPSVRPSVSVRPALAPTTPHRAGTHLRPEGNAAAMTAAAVCFPTPLRIAPPVSSGMPVRSTDTKLRRKQSQNQRRKAIFPRDSRKQADTHHADKSVSYKQLR